MFLNNQSAGAVPILSYFMSGDATYDLAILDPEAQYNYAKAHCVLPPYFSRSSSHCPKYLPLICDCRLCSSVSSWLYLPSCHSPHRWSGHNPLHDHINSSSMYALCELGPTFRAKTVRPPLSCETLEEKKTE